MDWGVRGTARWRRMCDLKGVSQTTIAKLCKPATQQPAINRFENAKDALTWERARQLAPAYFAELWNSRDPERQALAVNGVWKLWFANVAAYGSAAMKQAARDLQANWTEYPWEEPATGLFADQAPKERLAVKVQRMIEEQAAERAELEMQEMQAGRLHHKAERSAG